MDAGTVGELFGWLLSLGAVYVYDIPSIDLGQGLGQLVPKYCRFWDFLSI